MRDRTIATSIVLVRPLYVGSYALLFSIMAVFFVALGLFGSGPLGVRLIILVVFPVFCLSIVAVMFLRAVSFARPGLIRPGLGRIWLPVDAPQSIFVDAGVGRWSQIYVLNDDGRHPVVTINGPLWFGSQKRFERTLDAARAKLVAGAFPSALTNTE